MSDYKKLKVWKNAHRFAIDIYNLTKNYPDEEKFGMIAQIRRSSLSIPTNIVEGCGQNENGNLIRYLGIAKGSAFESEYHLLLSKDLGFISEEKYTIMSEKIKYIIRMLTKLIYSLKMVENNK
ncbi:MAG: four helix bundle protein [Candidatus Caldatribacteriota bacterium]|jgi:four helix bundle protein|nr:four helix bundle protein [Atribacterota bacterium]MDD4289396.1 four helix bundle protein [Atribacterota bacterium]MDD4765148.1 four helix bundle protein [Atribacterota bacterium]MDI9597553.1 four helix bundle protein [Atribacterota bacterium]